ncbi:MULTISPECIES: EscU/YscU/HrcU family type III secretion system export apparatus switch protein [unclassified Modestobacter]|uniref:EscU/YscU/HrcU family type III secretion system export apparatus switch protein n=1 Tax=unclassified Modestobacter TaxID=2643866 RepID=UPI0022AB4B56|nr:MULTISPECIES: EscU/YscU/HrcU family type III secretion system export apparatus switch protein [unclassified Modestobacter]MCZ2825125.1 EscU/YscU/HrcU family type III secretion system export apparatus switch protein [Modestobacter sp. VKM Ac-2981]MCZ2853810.1 EscU/YscU/HrcU family type III secretion system export apparatus switch protein [Modestobacter sp. VKM Ac-2982]
MAKDGPGGEKTEAPTPKKLKDARKEGQIPRTQELGTWLGAAAASVLLPMLVGGAFGSIQELFVQVGVVANDPEPATMQALFGTALAVFMTALLPMALAMMVIGTVASAAQGGVTLATKAMKPTMKKLNPFPGIKRMFGTQGLWEATKAIIKTVALAVVIGVTSDNAMQLVSASGALPLSEVVHTFTDSAVLMFRVVGITGLVIAVADYIVVRHKMMKQLKMSVYEIKQEHKQAEGDPYMKAQRRSTQLSMSRNRMMAEVADADVLLVNPTHVAVALKYDPLKGAPRVVAKGADEMATRLRARAEECKVPMVQDIPLARALHASCDLGQEVPAQLFTAVARVLAFVMHLSARGVRGGVHRPGFEAPVTEGLPRAGRRR